MRGQVRGLGRNPPWYTRVLARKFANSLAHISRSLGTPKSCTLPKDANCSSTIRIDYYLNA